MFNTKDLQKEIIKLKKENDVCILAHAYQTHDILEVADYVGDSFGLSKVAAKAPQNTILMCGVRFMAETVKILSPSKRVLLSHSKAGCPMAEQLTVEELRRIKAENPDYSVVAYINTTSELKTECDACVTSASALEIVRKLKNDKILFIPDCNLGSFIASQVPGKTFKFIKGGCPVHMRITVSDVEAARREHPDALLLVHPECVKEVTALSDYAGSTTGIMDYVAKSDRDEFVIGTDNSIVEHLQFTYPDKRFFALSKNCVCHDMRLTTLVDVYNCLRGKAGEEITLPVDVMSKAKKCIDTMMS